MVKLQVTLPDWASDYINGQVEAGSYHSADELLTDLINRARTVVASDRLAELVLEGEKSGEGYEFTEESWARRMAELRAEAERRRSA